MSKNIFKTTASTLAFVLSISCAPGALAQGSAEQASPTLDEVTLKNGSKLIGDVVNVKDGVVTVKSAFAAVDDVIKVKWAEVADIRTSPTRPLPIAVKDSVFKGSIAGVQGDNLTIRTDASVSPVTVAMADVRTVNVEKKPIDFKINSGVGVSISDGNSNNRTASAFGEFEARSERQRLNIHGSYNYGDNDSGVTLRNGAAGMKYDFFLTQRFFWYASALFEHDGFQDLSLRTALSTGPGYQFIDKGDFKGENFREMQLFGEAGIAYFSEDHKSSPDDTFVSARWAVKFDWPILPKQLTLFHYHEGYPGLEKSEDLYINSQQGVRFNIWQGLVATFQVNWKWDNTPTPGFERSDTLYLVTFGFSKEF